MFRTSSEGKPVLGQDTTYMVNTANTLMEVTKIRNTDVIIAHQCSDSTGIFRCCAILDALCQKAALYPLLKK